MTENEQLITINNGQVVLRKLTPNDADALLYYLHHLSDDTKRRFGPHAFDRDSVVNFYHDESITGYIAADAVRSTIIAYSIIKTGYLFFDAASLSGYGLVLNHSDYCTFAPSVADQWQSLGIGKAVFNFILSDLQTREINKIILWGGVQADNKKAVNFYTSAGFKTLGKFEHNAVNFDMLMDIEISRQPLTPD